MPGPGVYVIGVVGTIAAGLAFKEFVYEPYIAPKLEQWAEEFVARRKAKRLEKQGLVAVPQHTESVSSPRTSSAAGKKPDYLGLNKRRDSIDHDPLLQSSFDSRSIELEHLVSKELREWRSEVASGLRHRKNAGSTSEASPALNKRALSQMDESNPTIPYVPISPTHVLYDISAPQTPTSTVGSTSGRMSPMQFAPMPHKGSPSFSTLRTISPSPSITARSQSAALSATSSEMRSLVTAPWVAQQMELARSNALTDFTDTSSRASTPFSQMSVASPSPLPQSALAHSAQSIDTMSFHEDTGLSHQGSLMTLRQNVPPVASPAASSRPLSPESNHSRGTPGVNNALASSPTIQSLSFTHPAHEVSRPSSSLSFTSDANLSYSARSEMSFAQSDSFTDDDFADIISVSSGSAM